MISLKMSKGRINKVVANKNYTNNKLCTYSNPKNKPVLTKIRARVK